MGFAHTKHRDWGRAQIKSNKVPKDRGQASLGCCVLVPAFGTIEELSDEKGHTNFSN